MEETDMELGGLYRISYGAENRALAGKPVIFRGIIADRLTALGAPNVLVELMSGEQYRIRLGAIVSLYL